MLPKLTSVVNGTRKIIDDPPLIGHFDPEAFDGGKMIAAYAESLPPDRRPLLERYHVLDTARKVVGVGSVGTRCYLSLLTDADGRSPIFLQLKEAMEAVLAPYAGKPEFAHAGQRVVVGQRLMQAASDMFLGWTSYRGHDYDALVVAVESGRITAARGLLAAPPRGRGLLRASRIACW